MRSVTVFAALAVLALVGFANRLCAQGTKQVEYKSMSLDELQIPKETKDKTESKDIHKTFKSKGEFKKDTKDGFGGQPIHNRDALLQNLDDQGQSGWEVCAATQFGVLFRKAPGPRKWAYKIVRPGDGRLNGRGEDDETFRLALEALTARGWEPCAAGAAGDVVILKRSTEPPSPETFKKE
jgi:hypothetical protein